METSNINADLRARIFAAATKLYDEIDRENFPTVDAVRREAKAAMGDVSAVMKDWRKAQTAQAATPTVQVPASVLQLAQTSAQAIAMETWTQAQDLATESLRSAQQAWDTERAEAEALRAEMGEAYDALAVEIGIAQGELTIARDALEKAYREMDVLHADAGEAQQAIQRLESQVQSQTDKLMALQAQLTDTSRALHDETKARTAAEKALAVSDARLVDAIATREQDRKAMDTAHTRIASLEAQALDDRKALDATRASLAAAEARVAGLEGEIRGLRSTKPIKPTTPTKTPKKATVRKPKPRATPTVGSAS